MIGFGVCGDKECVEFGVVERDGGGRFDGEFDDEVDGVLRGDVNDLIGVGNCSL